MTDEICRICDQPFDADGYCWRCEHHVSEIPPEKTLNQLYAENPELAAYRDEVRARVWGLEPLRGDPLLKRRAA